MKALGPLHIPKAPGLLVLRSLARVSPDWRRGEFKGGQIDGKEELNLQHEVWGWGRLEGFTLILDPSMVVPQPMWGIGCGGGDGKKGTRE